MAFKFPDKDPDERLDYTVDWSRYLERDNLTITSVNWYIEGADKALVDFPEGYSYQTFAPPNFAVSSNGMYLNTGGASATVGLTNITESRTATTATIVLDKGIANKVYTLVCEIVTSQSNKTNYTITTNRRIKIKVRERV
jgi:hypothetical protein